MIFFKKMNWLCWSPGKTQRFIAIKTIKKIIIIMVRKNLLSWCRPKGHLVLATLSLSLESISILLWRNQQNSSLLGNQRTHTRLGLRDLRATTIPEIHGPPQLSHWTGSRVGNSNQRMKRKFTQQRQDWIYKKSFKTIMPAAQIPVQQH